MLELANGKAHRWTNTKLKKLIAAWQNGDSVESIAKSLNSTSYAISKMVVRMRRNGIPLTKRDAGHRAGAVDQLWTHSDVEYLLKRRKAKATAEEIALEIGRTYNAVNAMIQKLRLEGVGVARFGRGVRRLWDPSVLKAQIITEKSEGA